MPNIHYNTLHTSLSTNQWASNTPHHLTDCLEQTYVLAVRQLEALNSVQALVYLCDLTPPSTQHLF
jgi:hypothetical protein